MAVYCLNQATILSFQILYNSSIILPFGALKSRYCLRRKIGHKNDYVFVEERAKLRCISDGELDKKVTSSGTNNFMISVPSFLH